MSGPAAIWQQAADCFEQTMAQVGDDQWELSTGCDEWNVRELVDHTVFWQGNLGSIVGSSAAPEDGWDAVKAGIVAGLADPSVLEGEIADGPMKGMPKHTGIGLATADALLHAWDLGQAIGVQVEMPAEAVEAVQMGLSQMPEAMMRSPGLFGPEIQVADDASAQDKLLGFAGRQP